MCKEMPVIPVNKVVGPKRIIGKNGGPRRRREDTDQFFSTYKPVNPHFCTT
jgi:hypothetical protein